MQKRKMMRLSDIEWMAILKSVIFIEICFWLTVIISMGATWVFVIWITNDFEKSFEMWNILEPFLRLPGDTALFFGFWKSMSFIRHHKLQHMFIITLIICMPNIVDIFFYDGAFFGAIGVCAINYGLMFLAYFIRKAVTLWRKGRDAKA